MAKRCELSDEAWGVVSDLFIEPHGRGRPSLSDRLMIDGVLWVLCSGAAWLDMPERFGPWSTVYQRFRGLAKPGDIRSDAQTHSV
ncbi:transposase [Pseudomonas sp. 3JA]|uniref:transposase n=1 Tax=Pseudomonas sp. 3JA TaxID=3109347 RepID=UPI003FA74C53